MCGFSRPDGGSREANAASDNNELLLKTDFAAKASSSNKHRVSTRLNSENKADIQWCSIILKAQAKTFAFFAKPIYEGMMAWTLQI